MKDMLKNFTLKKALNQLSEQTIDTLLHSKAGMELKEIQDQRKTLSKRYLLEFSANKLQDNPDAFRILRTAYFFHQHKEKIPASCPCFGL